MPQYINAILRRKLGLGNRVTRDAGHITPMRALEMTVARAGQDCLRLPLKANRLTEAPLTPETVGMALPEDALIFTLEAGGEVRGAIALDAICLVAVVRALTTGLGVEDLSSSRAPTMTDAELCRGFAAAIVAGFTRVLEGHPAAREITGLVPGRRMSSGVQAENALPPRRYRGFSVGIGAADGRALGHLSLVVPWDAYRPLADDETGEGAESWTKGLTDRVSDSTLGLDAVLHRMDMPLSAVAGLAKGDRLMIPRRALGEISLMTATGTEVGQWKLGQLDACRALRLVSEGPKAQIVSADPEDQAEDATVVEPASGGRAGAVTSDAALRTAAE